MSAVLDSLATALALGLVIPWLLISFPVGAALSVRRGWDRGPKLGLGIGLAVLPIVGWLVVYFATTDVARAGSTLVVDKLKAVDENDDPVRNSDW